MVTITNPGQTNLTPHLFIPRNGPLLGSEDETIRNIATNFLAIQNWADMVVAGAGGGLRFATKVVAASDSVDLNPAHYDYLCTGSNDQNTINSALLAAGAGGRVLLMEGHYHVDPTVAAITFTADNQTLDGQGFGSYIKSIGGLTPPGGTDIIRCANHGGCRVTNLAVDGNDSASRNTSVTGIHFQSVTFNKVEGVHVLSTGLSGILIDTGGPLTQTNNVVVHACALDACSTVGIVSTVGGITIGVPAGMGEGGALQQIVVSDCTFNSCHVGMFIGQAQQITVTTCVAAINNDHGFYLDGADQVTYQDCIAANGALTGFTSTNDNSADLTARIIYSACQAVSNSINGFNINGVTSATLIGCLAQANGQHGFTLQANDPSHPMTNVSLEGCQAINNSQTTANTYDGFLWGDAGQPMSNCLMTGCMARGTTHKYGCQITVQATSLVCVINDFHASGTTGNFTDAGTGTIKNLDGSANNWNRL